MKVYKGTDKDMKCRGFQYELGVTVKADDAIRCGDKGFHSCEAPFDVLRYYPNRDGNRFFACTADGKIDRTGADDSKLASTELTLDKEIGLADLVQAQKEYTRAKAESGKCCGNGSTIAGGNWSNLAGGNWSNLAGGNESNLAGGNWSNLAGGNWSNLAGGNGSNLAGGNRSNLAGGDESNLAGGDESNLAGGNWSNLAGGDRSNLAGGNRSNLAGGNGSVIVGRDRCRAKAGLNSVIILSEWEMKYGEYKPVCIKAKIVDGVRIKADTWYRLKKGEFVECE